MIYTYSNWYRDHIKKKKQVVEPTPVEEKESEPVKEKESKSVVEVKHTKKYTPKKEVE